MRFTGFTSASARLNWVRIVVSAAYLCGMLMSQGLWFGMARTFPRAPVVAGLPHFVSAYDFVISIVLVGGLILAAIMRRPVPYLLASALLTLLLIVLDQMRLQPWVFQYGVMLALLTPALGGATNQRLVEAALAANQIVLATLYFWSGLQKLNWSFAHEVVPALFESTGLRLSQFYLSRIAVAIAICETLIGIGLLIRKTRQAAVIFACITHVIVLGTLVFSGRNTVVRPWNVAMILLTAIVFWRNKAAPFGYLIGGWGSVRVRHHWPKLAMLICGLLPALSFIGWWDLYLSAALYSGNTPIAVMRISESLRDQLPSEVKEHVFKTSRGDLMLPFYEWSLAELNVPPYPEIRVYHQVARQLCLLDTNQQVNGLIVKERPALKDGSSTVTLTSCSDLLSPKQGHSRSY
jgi:hypothetical protein